MYTHTSEQIQPLIAWDLGTIFPMARLSHNHLIFASSSDGFDTGNSQRQRAKFSTGVNLYTYI